MIDNTKSTLTWFMFANTTIYRFIIIYYLLNIAGLIYLINILIFKNYYNFIFGFVG